MAQGERSANPPSPRHTTLNGNYSTGFYNLIYTHYGCQTLDLLKQYSKSLDNLTRQKNRRIFLLRSKHMDLEPKFLNFNMKHVTFNCKYLGEEFKTLEHKFKLNALNLLISDTCKNINTLTRQISHISYNIKQILPHNLFNQFAHLENQKQERLFTKIRHKNIRKIDLLNNKQHKNHNSMPQVNDKYIENISNTQIPEFAAHILSLGPKFALPLKTDDNIPIYDLIASVEVAIRRWQMK